MAYCDYCGKEIPRFQRIKLVNGYVCQDCFHWANYGGYGTDNGRDVKMEWIDLNIEKRTRQFESFSPTISTQCGLEADDNQRVFMYGGWPHIYSSLYSFRSFFNGVMHDDSCRKPQYSNSFRKPVKSAEGTCVFIQLHGYTYPSYIVIRFGNKASFDECISCLYHITEYAGNWESKFEKEMEIKKKEYELAEVSETYQRKMKELERLRKEI